MALHAFPEGQSVPRKLGYFRPLLAKQLALIIAVFTAIFGLFFSQITRASTTSLPDPLPSQIPNAVIATRITNKSAPFMDGVLEDIWQNAGKITVPNSEGGCFTLGNQNYNNTDPSTFTVYYLHDDINLYIAIQTNDKMVEGSDYDQNSDGLAGMAIERKGGGYSMFRLTWFADTINSKVYGPPLDRDRMIYDAEWRMNLAGTWNDNKNDQGYIFEFFIPLNDPTSGSTTGLGGWTAGEQMKNNLVLVDHDSKPKGAYEDPQVNFRKCWWGSDKAENLNPARWIILSNANPIGEPGNDKIVTARRIKPGAAPVIDGIPDEPIWQQAHQLRFPSSVGKSFTPSPSQAAYNTDDPTAYTLSFLHDDTYLYVSVKSNDRKIEAAAYDQASDGLISMVFEVKAGGSDQRYATYWHQLDQWEIKTLQKPITICEEILVKADLHFQEGPPRYPYHTSQVTWGPIITGTWNNNNDRDAGYAFEYKLPLTETLGITKTLGGYKAGELIPVNIVLVDHDDNPMGTFDDPKTHFKKFWWSFDGNEFYPLDNNGNPGPRQPIPAEEERYIFLDSGTPYGNEPQLDPAKKAIQYIVGAQLEYSGLLRSFQDEMAAHTYDNAVALIALTDAGKRTEAQKLAKALVSVLETEGDQGFFYDAYNVVDKRVSQGTASGTGPNTWAAYALAYYGKTYCDPDALDAADKVTQWVIKWNNEGLYDSEDGGVWGGVCHPFQERSEHHHVGDEHFPFKSTEQVIDTWHLFRIMSYTTEADRVAEWLTSDGKGWIENDDPGQCRQDKRFATGVDKNDSQNKSLFLDVQSWGSIVANMIGKPDKAEAAIKAAEEHLLVNTEVNGQEISGFDISCEHKDNIIWYGGTAHMIVAYVYNEAISSASSFLNEMAKVQNKDGPWSHSSGNDLPDSEHFHTIKPHLGETAWNYFALRDVNDDARLPYNEVSCRNHLPIIFKKLP